MTGDAWRHDDRRDGGTDPATLPPDDVRAAFMEAAFERTYRATLGDRLAARLREVLAAREIGADAQSYAIALLDWGVHDVAQRFDATGVVAALPHVRDLGDVEALWRGLRGASDELYEALRALEQAGANTQIESALYEVLALLEGRAKDVKQISLYVAPVKFGRRTVHPRPTPLSKCVEAAGGVGDAVRLAAEVAPHLVEDAVERLGLAGTDDWVAQQAARSRRALTTVGISDPSARVAAFARILCAVVDSSPRGHDPAELVARAMAACGDSAAGIVGDDPVLARWELVDTPTTVDAAATAVLDSVARRILLAMPGQSDARG